MLTLIGIKLRAANTMIAMGPIHCSERATRGIGLKGSNFANEPTRFLQLSCGESLRDGIAATAVINGISFPSCKALRHCAVTFVQRSM